MKLDLFDAVVSAVFVKEHDLEEVAKAQARRQALTVLSVHLCVGYKR